ncbi:MAG: hypothetical protein AMXMBFR6_16290 [Betaproteobacteria bacterium]|nr:arginase [Rhodocyclaceae bacterium]
MTVAEHPSVVRLLSVASNRGYPTGHADRGSEVLRPLVAAWLHQCGVVVDGDLPVPVEADEGMAAMLSSLSATVAEAITRGRQAWVVGGDHVIAAGTWRGVSRALATRVGLLWIDAHLDAHTPWTSPSGNAHGMPLAALLGRGDPAWSGPCLDPTRVVVFGARSHEPAEQALLRDQGVRVIEMSEIRRRGLSTCWREAVAIVADDSLAFGLTIDLDAFDPDEIPGVATPVPGGLAVGELAPLLFDLVRSSHCVAVEITEFDPELDASGRSIDAVRRLVLAMASPTPHSIRSDI